MRARGLAVLGLLLLAGCASPGRPGTVPADGPAVSLLGRGRLVLPRGLAVDGLHVGGLSALVRVGGDEYAAVIDNEGATDARLFRLAFRVTAAGVSPLPGESAGRIPRSVTRLAGFNGETLDGEGLARTPAGTWLVSSETEPSIREFSDRGELLGELPVPEIFRPAEGRGIYRNFGFEGVALTGDGRILWTANERSLAQDGDNALERPAPVRLLRYDRAADGPFAPGAQYVYEVEPVEKRGTGFATRGISDLLVLPEGDLLVLEREWVDGIGNRIALYRVDLAGATDVSALPALAGAAWKPVKKTLLYDFAQAGFPLDNIEGLALGPALPDGDRTLVLVSDDNFKEAQETQILALRLRVPHDAR